MSAEALGWVVRRSPFSGSTFAVHLMIADSANDQHDHDVWMSQTSLAAKARITRQACGKSLRLLVDDGYLTVMEDNHHTGRPNRYRLEFPDVPVVFETRRRVQSMIAGGATSDCTPERERKENPKELNHSGPSGPIDATDTASPGAVPFPTAAAIRNGQPYPPHFVAFWNAYPRRIGKVKTYGVWLTRMREATKARIDLDRRGTMMVAAAKNYAESTTDRSTQFIKQPATFLGPDEHWKEFALSATPPDIAQRPRVDPGLALREI